MAVARTATTHCAYCQGEVSVPENYRAALLVAEAEVEADALTSEAFRTLGGPPALPLVLVDALTSGFAGVATTTVLTFIGTVHVLNWGLDQCQTLLHVNAWDWLARPEQELILWGLAFLTLLALYALGAFGRRRATDLQRLQQALTAKPPAREGGPALCRHCGAPLTVPKNARGVRCAYCRTDNLLAVPAAWLARAKGFAANVKREAKSALHQQRSELGRLRRRLALRLGIIGALAALMLTSIARRAWAGNGGTFDLRAALVAPRTLFDVQANTFDGTPTLPAPQVPIDQCKTQYVLHPVVDMSCIGGDCWVAWFVAMRAGEVLELAVQADGVAHLFTHTRDNGWNSASGRSDLWGEEIAHESTAPQRAVRFRAPTTTWYRLNLDLHGVSTEVDVCAKIH